LRESERFKFLPTIIAKTRKEFLKVASSPRRAAHRSRQKCDVVKECMIKYRPSFHSEHEMTGMNMVGQ